MDFLDYGLLYLLGLYIVAGLVWIHTESRIVWRNINGKRRWFVQLVQEGVAPAKYDFHSQGLDVGLDIGPSTIAVVSESAVALEKFAPGVDQPWREARRIQRAMDRSRRATNPHCYNANGTIKKGAKCTVKSRRYLKLQAELAERAPSAFVSTLTRKAESASGKVRLLNTWALRMSQYDHVTGECTKKPLRVAPTLAPPWGWLRLRSAGLL